MTVLEAGAKQTKKGRIPVLQLPTFRGNKWEDLAANVYSTEDHIVAAEDIQLDDTGTVYLRGVGGQFRLTSFSATGFAWCSMSEDRPCTTEDAAKLINEGFEKQGKKEWRIRATEGGTIITIVSPDYVPLKTSTLVYGAQQLRRSLPHLDYYILSPYGTSLAFHSDRKFRLGPREELSAGIRLNNGEDGKHALEMTGRLWQAICSNGAIFGSGITMQERREHKNEGSWEDFDVVGKASEIITNVLQAQDFVGHLEDMSINKPKVKQDTFQNIVVMGQLGPRQVQAFEQSYVAQRDLRDRAKTETMFDVFNAVTGMKNYFPKSKPVWEELGGRIIVNPKDFWAN